MKLETFIHSDRSPINVGIRWRARKKRLRGREDRGRGQTRRGQAKEGSGGRKSVKLTKSQVVIAKKLGVPLEEYAKYVKEGA